MLKNGLIDVLIRLILVTLIAFVFIQHVKMEPKIDSFFFFAADDPACLEASKVDQLFSEQNQVVISASTKHISSPAYYRNIQKLSRQIAKINGVRDVKSLSHGPKSYQDAVSSPLWRSFLLGKSGNSSLIIIELDKGVDEKTIVPQIEHKVLQAHKPNFSLQMSGMPFLTEKIRVHLIQDMKVFSSSAIIIFGILLVLIFGSIRVLLGTVIACFAAIMITLITMELYGISLGILTANLSTIVFILTQSHIIFLTSNWKRIGENSSLKARELALKAMQRTFTASFWCMVTTLLGFLSLILVPAKPLKDLGLGGAIGTLVSIVVAYSIYPSFLTWMNKPRAKRQATYKYSWVKQFSQQKFYTFSILTVIVVALIGRGIYLVDVDPGLHEYFDQGTALRQGLEDVDQNGGSSILSFVISDKAGNKLNNRDSYKRMQQLNRQLVAYPAVGALVSLPHLIAETERHPLSFLFSIRKRLDMLASDKYDNAASGFVTPDHRQGHYLMRIIESKHKYNRSHVIQDLKNIASKNGFNVDLVGGVYYLQEELAKLIRASITRGILMLLGLFLVIAYIVSRSIVMSLSMVVGMALIPLAVLGTVGYKSMPLDIFATPAVNVCMGIAVDTMIHFAIAVRVHAGTAKVKWQDWIKARQEQMGPILISTGIVAAGFSIFLLSYFPPTYRFGIQVVIGTLLAAVVALVIFPAFGSLNSKN